MTTRIPILDVRPRLESGRFPAKAATGETFVVSARIFGVPRHAIGASVILTAPDGTDRAPVRMQHIDNDFWGADVSADEPGSWTFRIESWFEPYAAWLHDAPLKIEAGVDVEVTLQEGALLLERSTITDPAFVNEIRLVRNTDLPVLERLAACMSYAPALAQDPIREQLDTSMPYPLQVDRARALFSSWYELFPRSEGATIGEDGTIASGTFATAAKRLEAIARMNFDIVYLPPIHPIGTTNRKGRNNALAAEAGDPGSPWAIGSADGGHDAIHPELGTLKDFDQFVSRAGELGLEIALDLALQCSPDHPWVTDHPEWFRRRADGSIAFAENPPKKYQDIYPLSFDEDFDGLCAEIVRILRFWMARGVRVFRVDNPHTKPLRAWERILREIRETDPDVIFLSEAFTVPAMLHALAMVGFQQSYTYFTWREHKGEVGAYLTEVAQQTSHFMRPNFFVNTPDILPTHLHSGEPAIFKARAALAALGSPSWGMYAGYELCEHEPVAPGSEDHRDSEKYAFKIRDWDRADSLADYIGWLNAFRRAHPALQQLRDLYLHRTDDPDVICFSKHAGNDRVLGVIDLSPGEPKTVRVSINAPDLGLAWGAPYTLHDQMRGGIAAQDEVALDATNPVAVFTVTSP